MSRRKRKTNHNNRSNEDGLPVIDEDGYVNPMHAMNMQMRSMNRLMNSLMPDPFNMLTPFDSGFQQNALMDYNGGRQVGGAGQMGMGMFGFPAMPNINRLLSADIGAPNGASYCSSSVITMSSGPDGRPQVYQASTSTKTGPNGVRETRKTVQDSTRGIKKMAIGHHIGERAHIIEKEQDLNSGQLEERQEFVNLDEEQAEEFDREFTSRAQTGRIGNRYGGQSMLTIEPVDDDDDDDIEEILPHRRRQLLALPAPPQAHSQQQQQQSQQQPHNSSATSSSSTANDSATTTTIDLTTSADDNNDIETTSAKSNNKNHHNNSNNLPPPSPQYIGGPTRPRIYHHRAHHLTGVAPRRPLRTPPSSPLATTPPTQHINSSAASLSVHPHPYNTAAARRNFRPKHTKQHQQQQQSSQQSFSTNGGKSSPKHNKK